MCLNSLIFLNGRNGTERCYSICRQWKNNNTTFEQGKVKWTDCVETECSLNQKREFDSSVRLPYIRAATATKNKNKRLSVQSVSWESSTYLKTLRVHHFVRSVAVDELRGVGCRLFFKARQCAAKLVTEMGAKGFDHEMSQELGKSTSVKERKITNIRTVLLLF
jgi:hypothetical protein